MAKFIIEIIHPLRFLREYKTFDAPLVRIGRGYDNDLIVADPHVSARHLIVRAQGEEWAVEDISRENGMFVPKFARVVEQASLKSGDELIIGRTRLRFLSPEHPVAATKLLVPTHVFLRTIGRPVNMGSILIVCLMGFAAHVYLISVEETSIWKLAAGVLGFVFSSFFWAGVWAFIGRMIKHKTQFAAQSSLSLLFVAAVLITVNISEYLGYWLNSETVETVIAAILLGGLCTVFLIGNLTLATNVSLKQRIAVCSSISIGIIAVAALLYYSAKDEFNPEPAYFASLKPPVLKILSDRSIDQFLAETTGIFDFPEKFKQPAAK
ncbi:MAG: FHA domain-containing protein [Candidatus Omnitrophica bacterium]|nr:FHA domain-containing protein [Candidatus Omnitrophota bacterium]